MRLQFLGANRQVTGSRYYLEAGGLRLLIDCGMFQERAFKERNWQPPPVAPGGIDFLLLTHAHLDHSGLIPRLVSQGFQSPILSTAASIDLARIVLHDAAQIQQEDAEFKRQRHAREGRTGPHPVTPLYTVADAERALGLLRPVNYGASTPLNDRVSVRYLDAGHILGSSSLELVVHEGGQVRRLIFSGDIGQWGNPLIHDPTLFPQADYLVMESTYGDRNHVHNGGVEEQLAAVVNEAVEAGGNLLIPTFALERAQELLYYFSKLVRARRIPRLMIFLDSPMAIDATETMVRHPECLDAEVVQVFKSGESPFRFPGLKFLRTVDESKSINNVKGTCVIMAGSGMCDAGRIKHHLARDIGNAAATVLFVGYQGQGTLGREILDRRPRVRIFNQVLAVKARIAEISGLSAHADQSALLRWSRGFQSAPRQAFITHGEEAAAMTLADLLRTQRGWPVTVPEYGQSVELV